MRAVDLRSKSLEELNAEKLELLKEKFNLQMQKGTGQLEKSHLIGQVKKNIARINTVISEKESV
jgi:large subunit ribosomal protein L29